MELFQHLAILCYFRWFLDISSDQNLLNHFVYLKFPSCLSFQDLLLFHQNFPINLPFWIHPNRLSFRNFQNHLSFQNDPDPLISYILPNLLSCQNFLDMWSLRDYPISLSFLNLSNIYFFQELLNLLGIQTLLPLTKSFICLFHL